MKNFGKWLAVKRKYTQLAVNGLKCLKTRCTVYNLMSPLMLRRHRVKAEGGDVIKKSGTMEQRET